MTKEDINKISNEEFIELVKKYLPKYTIDKIYNDKLCKKDKRTYYSCIITLGLIMGIIPIKLVEELFNINLSLPLTTSILSISTLGSYKICKNERKKDSIKRLERFNNELIKLKKDITNLLDEEFDVLIRCYDYINNNETPDELFKYFNVLEITDKLLEIRAVNLLKEFEISSSENESLNHYNDSEINMDKSYIKSNF